MHVHDVGGCCVQFSHAHSPSCLKCENQHNVEAYSETKTKTVNIAYDLHRKPQYVCF